jgi:GT2 family glycosyltransferase
MTAKHGIGMMFCYSFRYTYNIGISSDEIERKEYEGKERKKVI